VTCYPMILTPKYKCLEAMLKFLQVSECSPCPSFKLKVVCKCMDDAVTLRNVFLFLVLFYRYYYYYYTTTVTTTTIATTAIILHHPVALYNLTFSFTFSVCVQLHLMFTPGLFIINVHCMYLQNWPSSGVQVVLLE
jgi:hypothetical protein